MGANTADHDTDLASGKKLQEAADVPGK